ncbi:MAG TPA: hypothetical protein VFM39_00925 [bacterium]|nr:hypothetical protein [bacterium]
MSRRATLEALRAGPALVSNLPVEVVDLDRLIAHLVARGFDGGVHIAGTDVEGLLWVYDGAPREVWIFEAGGIEAILQGEPGRDIVRQIATKGGAVSVHPGTAPPHVPLPELVVPDVEAPHAVAEPRPEPPYVPRPAPEPAPPARPEPAAPYAVVGSTGSRTPTPPAEVVPQTPPEEDPSPLPWPEILEEVAERVARHRGPRLAARFMSAVASALAPYGGRVANGRIIAPTLARSTWRIVVETACGPVVAIAGRAFVDRTIAAAERHVAGGVKDSGA